MEDNKAGIYEMQLIDFMHTLQERYDEIDSAESPFEDGRKEAYEEIIDMIKTRYSMISDVLTED